MRIAQNRAVAILWQRVSRKARTAVVVGATCTLATACTDTPTDTPKETGLDWQTAPRIALYDAVAAAHGSPDIAGFCLSEGDGRWTAQHDPSLDVLEALAGSDPRFVAASTCAVGLNSTLTGTGDPAVLLHIEAMERVGNQAQALLLLRRSSLDASTYYCAVRSTGESWISEDCTLDAESSEIGLRVAAYLQLRELSVSYPSTPNSYAFCLGEGGASEGADPAAAVLFRLRGAPRPIVGGSTCTWNGIEFLSPEGRSARALSIESVARVGSGFVASGYIQDGTWVPRYFDCTFQSDGRLWAVQKCEPNTDPGGSPDDDVDIRIALYEVLIGLEGWAGASTACLGEGPWTDLQDAPAAVVGSLRDPAGSFAPVSTCAISFERTSATDGDPAQLLVVQDLERHRDYARGAVAYQRNGLDAGAFNCQLNKQGGNWNVAHCRQDLRFDTDTRSIAVYQALSSASTFEPPAAYCMSNVLTGGSVPDDPRDAVMFRLAGADPAFIAASGCQSSGGARYTADGERAHTLHIGSLSMASAVGVYAVDGNVSTVFDCTLSDEGRTWTATCTPRVESSLTEDDIEILVAAYRTLAEWVEPWYPDRSKDAFCVGEQIGSTGYLRDAPAAVMERLSSIDPRFVRGSECRLAVDIRMHRGLPPLVYYVTGEADWGWPLLVGNVIWKDGVPTTTVAISSSIVHTFGYTCTWERADGGWRMGSCTNGWIT